MLIIQLNTDNNFSLTLAEPVQKLLFENLFENLFATSTGFSDEEDSSLDPVKYCFTYFNNDFILA